MAEDMSEVEVDVEIETDESRRKKRKATRACDRCNLQHQPCDNAVPKCSVCMRVGAECTYNRPVRKRGPRSGYTGQNGERLWAIVLQARPELEDIVLQILRSGTYANTGISNLDYFRNGDNQSELVTRFKESRLGRFLQNGESPDLLLPPIEQQAPSTIPLAQNGMGMTQSSNSHRQSNMAKGMSGRSNRSMSCASLSQTGPANPHGAPENPADIYIQSDEIRRRPLQPVQTQISTYNAGYSANSPQNFGLDRTPSAMPVRQNSTPSGSVSGYGNPSPFTNESPAVSRMKVDVEVNFTQQPPPHDPDGPPPLVLGADPRHLEETSRWYVKQAFKTTFHPQ